MTNPRGTRIANAAAAIALSGAAIATMSACAIPELIGGMAESARLTGSTTVPAEYKGLEGHTWAVVTLAPRGVQYEVPNLVTATTNATTRKLVDAQNEGVLGSAGFLPGPEVLLLQSTAPSFNAWSFRRMGEELGVERLIVIDVSHLQLYERGNALLWDGQIAARVGVVEVDSGASDFAYQKDISITYPDESAWSTDDLPKRHVVSVLLDRLSDRAAWLFFEHEEPNVIEY